VNRRTSRLTFDRPGVNAADRSDSLRAVRWFAISVLIAALILVPFVLFEEDFNRLAARLASGEGASWYVAAGIGGLLAADVLLPIPSSVVSAAAGVFLGFARGALVVWLGMTISCGIGYWIGARSSAAARRFVGDEGLARASALAGRYGDLTLILCRPVPVLAEATVIVAGLVGTPPGRFFVICAAANAGVALSYAAIGAFSMRVESFLLAFLGAVLVPALGALVARLWLGPRVFGRPGGDEQTSRTDR
jgi:uncharacterized membrane protein YdjX (TVP38/TMEM64 family)